MWQLEKQQPRGPAYQCAKQQRNLGPSASSSNSNPTSNDTQSSIQGGSGAITTVTAGSGVNYNDPTLQLATVQSLANIVGQALGAAGGVASQSLTDAQNNAAAIAQIGAQQSGSNSDLISQVLAQEQDLASYQGTNGGLQTSVNTKYLIWGGVAVAGLALLAFVLSAFKK